jgi:hypothetical protein
MAILIELDKRRRTSLAKLGHKEHVRYLGETREDGTIVLAPAIVVAESTLDEVIAEDEVIEQLKSSAEQVLAE